MIARLKERIPAQRGRILDHLMVWSAALLVLAVASFAVYYYIDQKGGGDSARPMDHQIATFETAVREHPDDASARANLAALYFAEGRYNEASEQYAIALMLNPALIYEIHGQASRQAALKELPSILERLAPSALVYVSPMRLGASLQLAAGLAPDGALPAWRAVFYAERGDSAAATSALQAAREASPSDPATWSAHVAVGRLVCDERVATRGELMLALLRDRIRLGVTSWDPLSREDGLGDYQLEYPIPALRSAGAPLSLVRSLPACG